MDHSIKGLLLRVYFVLFNFFFLSSQQTYTHTYIPSLSIVLDFVFIAVYFISIGYFFFTTGCAGFVGTNARAFVFHNKNTFIPFFSPLNSVLSGVNTK